MQIIDMTTLTLSSLLIVGFVAPFALYTLKAKRAEKEIAHSFHELTKEFGVSPTIVDKWRRHYTLGLDKLNNKLIYFRYGDFPQQAVFNLDEVHRVSVQEKNIIVLVGTEKRNILEYVAIQLHFKDPKHLARTIEIYDGELFTSQLGERVIANKWRDLLNTHLNIIPANSKSSS